MTDSDFASADVMVLGAVAANMASQDDAAYAMQAMERFGVRPEWFRNVRYRAFYEALLKTWREFRSLDLFHVKERFEEADFMGVVQELIDNGGVLANIDWYLGALKQKFVYGRFHQMLVQELQDLKPDNVGVQVEDFVKKVHDLQEELADNDTGLRQISDFMESSIAMKLRLHEERFVKHNWAFLDGIPWPWHQLNQVFSGLKTGLHVIGALASQGKSTMAVDLSVFWNQRGIRHGYISIDMAAEQFVDRYPCVSSLVSLAKLNFGGSAGDVAKFKAGFGRMAKLNNVWISEADDVKAIEYQCYRGVRSLGWKAIVIDYIQLVTWNEGKGNLPEYTRVQRCVQEVKKIAKRLKVPVVCLAQLSRAFEKELRDALSANKGGVEPGLDAIGDSAEIARAAASVTVIYQDEDMRRYWKESPPTQLAFGDREDCALRCGVIADETDEEATARRTGQLSLAKSIRPVWVEVLKNQQGGKGKFPFLMFANYFLFRPGDAEGEDQEVTVGGKQKKLPVGKFEHLSDDWVYTDQDWWLEMTGVMRTRGPKLMGETYPEMRRRQAEERAAHPDVRHFVREYAENGRTETGWHWQEAGEGGADGSEDMAQV